MYCATCGSPIIAGLSYCNRCGARTGGADDDGANKLSGSSFNFLVVSVIALPIIGLGIIIALLTAMKKDLGFGDPPIMIVVFLSFFLLLVAEGSLIWLLMNHTKKSKKTRDNVRLNESIIKEINEARPRELGAMDTQDFVAPQASVIENTTRTFEPIRRESKT